MTSTWKLLAQTVPPVEVIPNPETAFAQNVGVGLLGIVISLMAGFSAGYFLRQRKFDAVLAVPWKPLTLQSTPQPVRYADWIGRLVALTGIVLTVRLWLDRQFPELAGMAQVVQFVGQFWLLVGTTLLALWLSRLVASAVLSIFNNPTVRLQLEALCPHEPVPRPASVRRMSTSPAAPDSAAPQGLATVESSISVTTGEPPLWYAASIAGDAPPPNELMRLLVEDEAGEIPGAAPAPGTATATVGGSQPRGSFLQESFADTLARIIGIVVYLLVFLPVFMIAAEVWGWTATGDAIGEIWQWLLPFVALSAAVLIGWFALTAAAVAFCPPEQKSTVMIITTVVAMIVLVASFHTAFAIVFLTGTIVLAWFMRHEVPDLFAGLYLRMRTQLTAKLEDGRGRVDSVDLLTSELTLAGQRYRVRNRYVLRSHLDGTMIENSKLVRVDQLEQPVASA